MIPPDVQSQMLRLLDGELSAGEFAALEAELAENPEAREAWQKLSRLHSALEVRYASQATLEMMPVVPIDRVLARQRRRVVKTSVLAAAAVLVITGVVMWMKMVPRKTSTLADFRATPGSIFKLGGADSDAIAPDGTLAAGTRLVLLHGAVELRLPHEVRAIVEGPAALVLEDDRTLRLDEGSAFFEVPAAGRGFTVVTPLQRIVDLGTAFGVDSRGGVTELHVFDGRVRVDDLAGNEGDTITARRSVLLAGARAERDLEGPPADFLRKLPAKVETLLLEDFESGLVAGREYAIRIDATVIRNLAGNRFPGIHDDQTWTFRTASSSGSPLHVASYTYDAEKPSDHQNGLFFDPDRTTLTDSNPGHVDGWSSGTYVGFRTEFAGSDPQVTFDLGEIREVAEIRVHSHSVLNGTPEEISISASIDGVSFSPPVKFDPGFSGLDTVSATLDLTEWGPARFWRLGFSSSRQWLFLGEIAFHGASTAPLAKSAPKVREETSGIGSDEPGHTPPQVVALHPANGSDAMIRDGRLTMIFDEPVKFGTGRILVRDLDAWSESTVVVGDARISIDGRTVTILPPLDLADGDLRPGALPFWDSPATVAFLNPGGNGVRYQGTGFRDKETDRGLVGGMRGPTMLSLRHPIRREAGAIVPGARYTASVAVGARNTAASFLGYRLRLASGPTTLAEISGGSPPGPPGSVEAVACSWDAAILPQGVSPGDPLVVEIAPLHGAAPGPGYLDLDHVRVTVVSP